MKRNSIRNRLSDAGISMVELLVAVALLAAVVVSLAASSMYASRNVTRSRVQLEAAEFLQAELEWLLSVPYDELADGERTTPNGKATWTVADSFSFSEILVVSHYNPAPGVSVWDTAVALRRRP